MPAASPLPRASALMTWHRLAPWPLLEHPVLAGIAEFLARPEVHAQLRAADAAREYPHAIRRELHELGLSQLFTGRGSEGTGPTMPHLAALAALVAQASGSLAITVGVNGLALLPLYHEASETQLQWAFDRVEAGAFCALLLTERGHGSNLLRNTAAAERVEAGGEPTHYRVRGEKVLINGATFHELLITFLRTSGSPEIGGALRARNDFSMFIVERDATTEALPRWPTLPAPAADISGIRFAETIVPAGHRLGAEGAGFSLVQKTLIISRGGIGALASGCASRAAQLAAAFAEERNIYGTPISRLGAIAEGLLRVRALDLLIASASLKAAAMTNACGVGAAHYTSAAKYACCLLAEELVTEGRVILGGSALLAEHPYSALVGDVLLYGIFDGTSHLMLDQLQWRLTQAAALPAAAGCPLAQARAIFSSPPRALIGVLRERQPTVLLPVPEYLRRLDTIALEVSLLPLAALCEELFSFTRECRAGGLWEGDQALRFAAGHAFALVETLVALVEFCDPARRVALGMRPASGAPVEPTLFCFAFGWFGLRVAAAVRAVQSQAGRAPGERLADAERALGELFAKARRETFLPGIASPGAAVSKPA